MDDASEFADRPLDAIFTTTSHSELFTEELSPVRRKQIRKDLWNKVAELVVNHEVLQRQTTELQAEIQVMQATKEDLLAELTELKNNLYKDNLTGLLNPAGFEKSYAEWLQENEKNPDKKFIIIYIDVDDLKLINDTYSHSGGDAAITHFADALRHVTREGDIVARMHGDEFVLGLPGSRHSTQLDHDLDGESALDVEAYVHDLPARISEYLESSINDDNVPEGAVKGLIEALRHIQFSYGAKVCSGEDFNKPVEELVHVADKQMYVKKNLTKTNKLNPIDYSI